MLLFLSRSRSFRFSSFRSSQGSAGCSDLQPALPWEDRAEEARKVEARRERDRERSRKRRKERAASAA
ncbi:MAG: hypothetical protein DUD39_08075 [Coriobacteriaceae bacterium]|nr:MAG: hypothetical protein DUD39_08075 [Coriobacteriaceae bacterium]